MFYVISIIFITKILSLPISDDRIIFPDDERISDSADDLIFDKSKLQNDPDILLPDNIVEESIDNEEGGQDFENGQFFQGDIVLMDEQLDRLNKTDDSCEDNELYLRTGRMSETYRWPKNRKGKVIVPYIISAVYSRSESRRIRLSMRDLEKHTCIEFIPRTRENDYIYIESYDGCFANLGRIGGRQIVSLKRKSCMPRGIIMHELIHALGYSHMHNHEDRDKYVTIYWENIEEDNVKNFHKVDSKAFGNFGTPYDYKSVMHYGPTTFSKNGKRTIVPKLRNFRNLIGQRVGLSAGDTQRINNMYKCSI